MKLNEKKIILIISTLILVLLLTYLTFWIIENQKNNNLLNTLKTNSSIIDSNINDSSNLNEEEKTLNIQLINFEYLLNQNKNTVAWIKVNNTNIDFPVVKCNDNAFYLKHSFDDSYNSAGWIFADYRNSFNGLDKNIVIYGHNRSDGSMFSSLKNILNEKWYKDLENKFITLYTPNETCVYKVFSVYSIKAETYYTSTNFSNDIEYNNFLNTLVKRSIYNFNETLNESDTILTLSTCANNNDYRVVLHAKKMQSN